jgi:hypothetical protein
VWRFCGVSFNGPCRAKFNAHRHVLIFTEITCGQGLYLYMAFSVHTYNYACLIWQKGFAVMKGTCQFTQPAGGASMFVKQYFHGFSLLIH